MKGINPIEAHFEKILAGILGLAVLGVITWQVVLPGNRLSIGGKDVPVSDAYQPAEQAANRLKAQLDDPAPPLPEVPSHSIAQNYQNLLETPITERESLYAIGDALQLEGGEAVSVGGVRRLASFTPPAPSSPSVHSFRSTIDPIAAAEIEGLAQRVPQNQPFDTLAVSIQASIDGTAIAKALSEDPDGADGPLESIPLPWWRDRVAFVTISVERESFDGQDWSDLTTIPLAPEQISLEEDAREMRSSVDIGAVASIASDVRREVLRPLYPPTIAGEPWQPPASIVAAAPEANDTPEQREIRTLRRRLRQIDGTLADLDRQLETLSEREAERQRRQAENEAADQRRQEQIERNTPDRERSGGGGGGRGREGGGGGGGRGREGGGRDNDRRTERDPVTLTTRVEAQIERLREDRVKVVDRLVSITGDENEAEQSDVFDPSEYVVNDILTADDINVWTHDLTAQPGSVYRYRVRYSMLNPLFGRQPALAEDQKSLAESPIVVSQASPWSAPVETTRDSYFFVTAASGETSVGPATAAVDVYQFYYGFWRRGTTTVRPGDPLVAVASLPEGLRAFPPASESGDEPEPVELPQSLTIDTGVWLLDITQNPIARSGDPLTISTQRRYEVVLADGGNLVVRSPDDNPDSIVRLQNQLLGSSELGLDQLPPEPGAVGRRSRIEDTGGRDGGRDGGRIDPRQDPRNPTRDRDPRLRDGGG